VSELESDRMLAETARELELGDMRRELDLGGISMPDPKSSSNDSSSESGSDMASAFRLLQSIV
jgi:hypothetical protein